MMTEALSSARFGLPLLAVGQAQKEVTHNEALTLVDALVQLSCEAGPQVSPPIMPEPGQCWIVGDAATGAWAGHDRNIALWCEGGWRFMVPRAGMRCARAVDDIIMRFDGDGWIEPPGIANPAGGMTVDSEARAAITALITAMKGHGLLISG